MIEDSITGRESVSYGTEIGHKNTRCKWNRFGPMFAIEIRRKRVDQMGACRHWRWHLDEVFVKVNRSTNYLGRTVDHEGEVLECFVTKTHRRLSQSIPLSTIYSIRIAPCIGGTTSRPTAPPVSPRGAVSWPNDAQAG
jgi:hypothetical protein